MNTIDSLLQYHLPLVILWCVSLATYAPLLGSKAVWRLGLPPFFLAVGGFLIYWLSIHRAGGAPGLYATLMWCCLVLPGMALQMPALICAEWLRARVLKERARSANGPGSFLGLTRGPYL